MPVTNKLKTQTFSFQLQANGISACLETSLCTAMPRKADLGRLLIMLSRANKEQKPANAGAPLSP